MHKNFTWNILISGKRVGKPLLVLLSSLGLLEQFVSAVPVALGISVAQQCSVSLRKL